MSGTDSRYYEIFEHTPVALFDADVSELLDALDALTSDGVTDLRAHLENPEAVRALSAKVTIVDVNQCAVELYGAESRSDLQISLDRLFDDESLPVVADWLVSLARRDRAFHAEAYARTLRGDNLPVVVHSKLIGRRGVLGVVDGAALWNARRELDRSNTELSEFAYVASHDLQEPLRIISSYAQLFDKRYGGQLDDRATKYLNYIVDGAKRMQGFLADLLTLSRVGTQGGSFEPTALSGVVDEAIARATRSAGADSQVTRSQLPVIRADRSQMELLFDNLIGNAIKFRGEQAPRVQISAERSGETWQIAVADNGIGIEAKYLEEVFSPFRRLHGRADYSGTGMGLTIVKKIAVRHKGRVWVESEPGRGSTFYIALPAATSELSI